MKTPPFSDQRKDRIDDHQQKQDASERSQWKMAAGKGTVLQLDVVIGREGAKKNDKDQTREERRKSNGSSFHPEGPLTTDH